MILVEYFGIILVYCNLGLIFVVFIITSFSNNNIVPTKVIADNWKHGDIATVKSNGTKNIDGYL